MKRAQPNPGRQVESIANVSEIHEAISFVPRRDGARPGGEPDADDGHWAGFGARGGRGPGAGGWFGDERLAGERRGSLAKSRARLRGLTLIPRAPRLGCFGGLANAAGAALASAPKTGPPPLPAPTRRPHPRAAGIWSVAWSPGGGEIIAGGGLKRGLCAPLTLARPRGRATTCSAHNPANGVQGPL